MQVYKLEYGILTHSINQEVQKELNVLQTV